MMTTEGNRDESIDKSTIRVSLTHTERYHRFHLETEEPSTRL
jgi:hypothetical protein